MIGGFLLFLGNTIPCWALQFVPTGIAASVVATNPFWMLMMAAFIPPRESISFRGLFGLVVGFTGLVILLSPKLMEPFHLSQWFWAGVAGLTVASLCWSFGSIISRKVPAKTSLIMSAALQNIAASAFLLPTTLLFGQNPLMMGTFESTFSIGYLIVVGTLLGLSSYLYVMDNLSVPVASTFAFVTPVVTTFVGWWLLKETVTPQIAWGISTIILGVVIVQMAQMPGIQQRLVGFLQRPVTLKRSRGAA